MGEVYGNGASFGGAFGGFTSTGSHSSLVYSIGYYLTFCMVVKKRFCVMKITCLCGRLFF
ncbi:hypothetical protein IBBPl23_27A [Paenibacillus phage phiIBB_P123]|uniref:Uncharacterized protein n=1 Tax=Paenibacillus phage phiIBB_P123 TaxID=1337877 RepID=R9VW23_9CAUD|nr:hypothetical protein IBBPl23_27A [Paenibacillus phage phiIBB_P123]AGN89343.1 hypothetical protein IBBPl23_27A [Paenibacillus phage phiIBB_P123]